MSMKPFSQACENNKRPILDILKEEFSDARVVLEVGSGTGQHAVYFSQLLPELKWQTSDLKENHQGIISWLNEYQLPNVLAPIELDVQFEAWDIKKVDGVFSANTLHILSKDGVEKFFSKVSSVVKERGKLCVYGPFNYDGKFTSQSNLDFNRWLRARDSESGIRDIEWITEISAKESLKLTQDYEMPSNNRLLVWEKQSLNLV